MVEKSELNILIKKLNEKDFSVTVDEKENTISFQKFSPAGQDFFFEVNMGKNLKELENNVYKYYESYDVSYEAYLWLDNTGHGKNGAPYEMEDVLADMKACEGYIHNVWLVCRETYIKGKLSKVTHR